MASWFPPLSARIQTYKNVLPPAPVPKVFSPLDLSDCVVWLDANDSSTINVNGDLSGANVNRVMKWFDKAKPSNQNYWRHKGSPATSGLYNVHTMNQLNTVYFEGNTEMDHEDGGLTLSFQDRTFFAVIKPLYDLSGAAVPFLNIFNGFTDVGAMNTGLYYDASGWGFSMCENSIQCGITFSIPGDLKNNRMVLMAGQSSTDLSANVGSWDVSAQPLKNNFLAGSYYTGETQYVLNDFNKVSSQDIAEIILYGRLLTKSEQTQVLEYLADKWNLSGPTPND